MKKAYSVICSRSGESPKCKECFHSKAHEKEDDFYMGYSCSGWHECDWLEIERVKKSIKVRCVRLPDLVGK